MFNRDCIEPKTACLKGKDHMKRFIHCTPVSGLFTLAVLGLPMGFGAQKAGAQSIAEPTASPTAAGAPSTNPVSDWPPTREEWEQYKKDQQELHSELNEMKTERAASSATTQGQPLAGPGQAENQPALPGEGQSAGNSKNPVNGALKSLFAPRTEDEYFTPIDKMNPEHIRPDMPMEIGHYDDLSLYMGLHTVGRLQAIQQDNVSVSGVRQGGLNPGFQDPFANLSFLATIPNKLDVYADLYIASRPHPNTMYAHEGYLLFKDIPAPFDNSGFENIFKYVNVKVGAFDIDFGDNNYTRSNNAFVSRNPLIGNPLVDPNVEEIGGEVYSIKGPVYWLFGAGGGTTTEHFDLGAGASAHAKIWGNPLPDLRTSASVYYADLSGSGVATEHSDLYAAIRSGGEYSAVFGGGDSPGQITPLNGEKMLAVQGDATWTHWPWEMYSNIGWTQDVDSNDPAAGDPRESWAYGTIGPVYHFTPALYVAGRYSAAFADSVHGVDTSGWVDRIQLGGGYWLTENILTKIEYVYEQYHGFDLSDGVVSGVDAGKSPNFDGVVMEVSFSF